ncbi:MAG: elongation factor G [Candidatus Marinimicrobia bacterium]|jgi:elongation factor G|nr:elongation factor G [Candidatus Neomarinimicrobiota bacterium]MBT3496946.1 elongation factor G [Candidatus Neomarinimicrobiota bacterium]MBT3692134.1 elongation factor G [Candidatus Neomarinimicrobiota bacterium]MBT3732972.1 elongation factor G [Candidatus Neomarinimicrobiota bacterium]MBT4143858.1 elongation factor G [Candidatus Neomarinimicrobiota bacterium]
MKKYDSNDIRNFAIVGHGATGKTTLAEAMLVCGKEINRMGTIEAGNTVSDFDSAEKERQISIHATPLHMEWHGTKFNMIDAPGYSDFVGESIGSLAAVDMALVVIHAVNGVEVGTENMWSTATKYKIPKVLVINGLDREHSHFDEALAKARERFGSQVFPMQLPVNAGPGFNQVVDVLRSELITYKDDGSGEYIEEALPADLKDKVKALHEELIEYVAESDDSLLEKFFDEGGLSEEEMRAGIHHAIQNQVFIPMFCTAADRNIGVARLCDFIAKYGSSPVDRKVVHGTDESGNDIEISLDGKNTVLQVFKMMADSHGELSLFRVYAGTVSMGDDLYNTSRNKSERFGQLFILNGKNRTQVESLTAGDMGAVVKLKDTHTGNTLCSSSKKVSLPEIAMPNPNIHAAIVSKQGDEEKLAIGLATLHEEDPTFVYRVDSEVHQTIISGQGELHLRVSVDRLKDRFNISIDLIEPKVPYRETILGKGEAKYRHKKQSGGAGQFAEVWMRIESKKRGEGFEFVHSLVGQNVDRVFVASVEKGVNFACTDGIIAGCKVVDLKVDFYDGKMHPVDSKDIAFQMAGKHAFIQAFKSAKPCLLEPIMDIEVKIPETFMGDIMGDISGRRGKVMGMDSDGSFQIIKAQVPQAELYHYATTVRSLTGGRGLHSEAFSHYEKMPKENEMKVIASRQENDNE